MRVRERYRDERGAVAVMVGLAMVVLLGMLALTLDLGRAVGVRRDMVNAADAAALAAAQECALNRGPAAATSAANETASLNDTAATLAAIDIDPECAPGALSTTDPKLVTVTYSRVLDYYVAPILGFDDVTIRTTATAIWGAARKASAPIPLRINLSSLINCGIRADGSYPVTCYLVFDNQDAAGAANDWSWLYFGGPDGSGWDTTSCTSQAGGSNDPGYFLGGGVFDPNAPEAGLLNDPPPTYVCAYSGNAQDVVFDLISREGDLLTFPVVDTENFDVIGQGANLAWPVVAFWSLKLVSVYEQQGGSGNWPAECPIPEGVSDNSMFCLQLSYEGPQSGGSIPGNGSPYLSNLPAVALVK